MPGNKAKSANAVSKARSNICLQFPPSFDFQTKWQQLRIWSVNESSPFARMMLVYQRDSPACTISVHAKRPTHAAEKIFSPAASPHRILHAPILRHFFHASKRNFYRAIVASRKVQSRLNNVHRVQIQLFIFFVSNTILQFAAGNNK